MDVRGLTVGPVQENCFIAAGRRRRRGDRRRPGRRGRAHPRRRSRSWARTVEAILLTHTHFDHVGAVAPLAKATGAPVYCPKLEVPVLAGHQRASSRGPAFGPYEDYDPEETVEGGETLQLAGFDIDVVFTPGHSPGHVTYAVEDERRCSPATCSSRARSAAPTCPAATGRRSRARSQLAARALPRRDDRSCPGTWASPRSARERATNPFLAELVVRGAQGHLRRPARPAGRPRARRRRAPSASSRARATAASRRRRSRRPSCSPAASASRPTSSRRRCTPSTTAAGARSRCAPRAPRRSCRAYIEHGMHKLPQPVKLWYLSSFFRYEKPQAGRFRQFWQVGAEAIGSDDPAVDAEVDRAARDAARRPRRRGRRGCGSARSATPRRARATARSCSALPARARGRAAREEVRERIDLNPLRAFDSDDPGTQRGHGRARRGCSTSSSADDAEHFAEVRALLDARRARLRGRPDARARPRLLHAHGVRVHLRRARRPERRRRRRALRRPDRAARRQADARHAAGRPGSSGCCSPRGDDAHVRAARRPLRRLRRRPQHRATAFQLSMDARRAGMTAQMELAGRSLKGQRKQADRVGARWLAVLARRRRDAARHGDRRGARRAGRRRRRPRACDEGGRGL